MKSLVLLLVALIIGYLFFFERGEKPLSPVQFEQRLADAGFRLDPQKRLLLYPNQEALFSEKPITIQTFRITHSDKESTLITAASFSNEKISHAMSGKTRGFASRNWFFFGGIDTLMSKRIQQALRADSSDIGFRLKVPDVEPVTTNRPNTAPVAKKQSPHAKPIIEETLSRNEILNRFKSAGLTINRIEENKGMPGSVKRKLVVEPLDDFLLFIEEQGVFPIEFKTPEDAIKMHLKYKKGFRHGNWYFPGDITSELRNKLVKALEQEP